MKKLLCTVLVLVLLVSAVPVGAFQASATNGQIITDTEYSVRCNSAGDWNVFTFVPSEDGIYIFSSSGSLDTLGYIALEEGGAENENIKADGGQDNNFAVTYNMTRGTTYYLGSTVLTGSTGTYKVKIVKFEVDDGTINPITPNISTAVSTQKSKGVKFFSFKPSTSGKYIYYSAGNYDTQGYIFDEYWRQIAFARVGGGGTNFRIELDLQAGTTYYLGYATTASTTVTFNVMFYMETYINRVTLVSAPEKTTYIKELDAVSIDGGLYRVNLNLTGFSFSVNYGNGVSKTILYTYGIRGLNCATQRDLATGENNLSFSYMLKSSSFKISVEDTPVQSLSLSHAPSKTVYYEEDQETAMDESKVFNISLSGMCISVLYKDGTSSELSVNSAYGEEIEYFYFDHFIPASKMILGENTFTLTYYGVPLEFTVRYSLNSDNWEYSIDSNNNEVTLIKYIGTETQAVIPETLGGYPVTGIGDECFKDCFKDVVPAKALTAVKMTNRITSIGESAFESCTELRELTLPSDLTSVGKKAFFNLSKLEKLIWNAQDLIIAARENNTFGYMGSATENGTDVVFGFTCQKIPKDAFYTSSTTYSPKIGTIEVGENVSAIGANAFRNVKGLRFVQWDALEISASVGTANNIWNGAASGSSFEVCIGEYVQSLPANLFYSGRADVCPRISKFTVESKDTVFNTDTLLENSGVPLTVYCHYNGDESVNSAYRYCLNKSLDYVLLDSPVDYIYIHSNPHKVEYIRGEEFEIEGLEVYAVYEDNSQEEVTDLVVVSGYDKEQLGAQTLTLSYTFIDKTVTTQCEVLVLAEPLVLDSINIASPAQKTAFFTDDLFVSNGLEVNAVFTSGEVHEVSEFVILSGYDMRVPGEQSVEISYTYEGITRTTSYPITVTAVVPESIGIASYPAKTNYLAGEALDLTGLRVNVTYNSGKVADVTTLCTFAGYDMAQRGTQTVVITYTENEVVKQSSFNITVHNALQGITIQTLPATELVQATAFSAAGIVVLASFENGTQEDVSALVGFSGYDMNALGEQTVTVSYTLDGITATASYSIQVVAATLERLELVSAPTATQYILEPLKMDGMSVIAYYSDGTNEEVKNKLAISDYDNTTTGNKGITASYTFAGKTLSVPFVIYLNNKTATGIELAQRPNKTAYLIGEDFEAQGMQVNLLYSNSTKKALSLEQLSLSGFDSTTAGSKRIIVSYGDFSASFYVSVDNYEIALTVHAPAKLSYFYGEQLNRAGMYLTITMADETNKNIYSGYTVAGYNAQQLGTQNVQVQYVSAVTGETLSDSFAVTVNNFAESLQVSAPAQTAYYYGDALNLSGMCINAVMADGTTQEIDSGYTLAGYQKQQLGTQTVTVSYVNEKGTTLSDTFGVTISNFEQSIAATPPDKTEYFYGEAIDSTGLGAVITYADGSTAAANAADLTISGYNAAQLGTQSVQVNFVNVKGETLQADFSVSVQNFARSLHITALPAQTAYFYGDAISLQGAEVSAAMADGSEQPVNIALLTVQNYSPVTPGEQTVSLLYVNEKGENLTDTFGITLSNFEQQLQITALPKTQYAYGEALETTGLAAAAVMADGTRQAVDSAALSVSGYNAHTIGKQTLTVSFINAKGESIAAQYDVTVNNSGAQMRLTVPSKLTYYYGDALDTAGMSAVLENVDGSTTAIDSALLSVSGYTPDRLGTQSVSVSYHDANSQTDYIANFSVNVLNFEAGIELTATGKTSYFYAESLDTSAVQAQAVMADGSRQALASEALSFSGYDANTLGSQNITVKYTNAKSQVVSTVYAVEVLDFETSIMVTAPSKKQYYYGDALDTTGMKALAFMASGGVANVDVAALSCSGYNSEKLGQQTITVTLTNAKGDALTGSFKVSVNNFEKSLLVGAPLKTEYLYGEDLQTAGMTVTALMADGSTKSIAAASCTVSGYDARQLGEQSIPVQYVNVKKEVVSGSFTICVRNYATALSVSAPAKTQYLYGEALELSDVSAALTMADGSTAPVDLSALSVTGYDARQLGEQVVSIGYTEALTAQTLSENFSVFVNNYLCAIELQGSWQTDFLVGEALQSSGLAVMAVYADSSKADVSADAVISGYDMLQTGVQTVLVSYEEGGVRAQESYQIEVLTQAQRADVNHDGTIDIADISIILLAQNYAQPIANALHAAADVNRNGTVEIEDISLLLQQSYAK